jgi:hypothetical protein
VSRHCRPLQVKPVTRILWISFRTKVDRVLGNESESILKYIFCDSFAVKNHYHSPRFRPTRVPGIPRTGATDEDILKWLGGYYQFLRDHFDALDVPTSFLEFGKNFSFSCNFVFFPLTRYAQPFPRQTFWMTGGSCWAIFCTWRVYASYTRTRIRLASMYARVTKLRGPKRLQPHNCAAQRD